MTLKVGSTVYNVWQGLGVLARDFYNNGIVTHPAIITRDQLKSRPEQTGWYPSSTPKYPINRIQSREIVNQWRLSGVKVALFFETPFDWGLINLCRASKIKTVLMPMYECMPERLPAVPDKIINPSELDQQYYPSGVFIPVPVEYPWRKREYAREFVHNAGHGGLKGRNGTAELVEAMRHVKSDVRLTLRVQESSRQYWAGGKIRDANDHPVNLPANIDLKIGTFAYEEIFADGDVFVFPERFNGLSLPLQEARAAGMLVMCGDRFPMNRWLPTEPLIPVKGYRRDKTGGPYNTFDDAVIEPTAIAAKMDEWYGRDITAYSESGKEWAATMSWAALKPRYMEVLEGLL